MDVQFFNAETLLPSKENIGIADSFVTTMDKKVGFQFTNPSGFYEAVTRILNLGETMFTINANRRRYIWNKWTSNLSEGVISGKKLGMYSINLRKQTESLLNSFGGKTLLTFDSNNTSLWKGFEKVVLVNMTTPQSVLSRRVKFSGVNPIVIEMSQITSGQDFKEKVIGALDGAIPDVALFYFTLSKFNFEHAVSAAFAQDLLNFAKVSLVVEYDINKLRKIQANLGYTFPVYKRMYLNMRTNLNGAIPTWSTNRFAILDLNDVRYINSYSELLANTISHEFKEQFMPLDERVLAKCTLIKVQFNDTIEDEDEDEEEE